MYEIPRRRGRQLKLDWGWRLALLALVTIFGLASLARKPLQPANPPADAHSEAPAASAPPVVERAPEVAGNAATAAAAKESPRVRLKIADQTIRGVDGKVAFRGEVDVGPTVARIERGERLRFPNDGSVFQNRERRLPNKPRGYYHEFVHPTPGVDGPGPQRIVTGEQGEIYYTPDHYRTFVRLDGGRG